MSIKSRIDFITGIPEKNRGTFIPAPKSVKIELTAACQYRCSFCVKSLRPDDGEMDRKLYSRLVREMAEAGVSELGVFYIGESLLFSLLPEAIKEAKDAGIEYVFLTTNGANADPNKVEACMKAGLDSLKFSINFYDDEQFKEIAQVKPKLYHNAINHLKTARMIRALGGYKTKLYASSIAFDGEQGAKMKAIMADIAPHVDETYELPLYGMSGAAKAHGFKPRPGNPGRLENMREPLPCWSVFQGHITKDGHLAACCFGSGIDGDMLMADLKEVSFMDGWNSDKFQALRAAHLKRDVTGTPCETCAAA
jgi:hypothetical protein